MQMDVDKAIDDFDFHVRTAAEGYYDMVLGAMGQIVFPFVEAPEPFIAEVGKEVEKSTNPDKMKPKELRSAQAHRNAALREAAFLGTLHLPVDFAGPFKSTTDQLRRLRDRMMRHQRFLESRVPMTFKNFNYQFEDDEEDANKRPRTVLEMRMRHMHEKKWEIILAAGPPKVQKAMKAAWDFKKNDWKRECKDKEAKQKVVEDYWNGLWHAKEEYFRAKSEIKTYEEKLKQLKDAHPGAQTLLQQLCEAGVDVNAPREDDESNFTALMCAARNGHLESVEALLELPDIDAQKTNKYGANAMHYAAMYAHKEVCQVLRKAKVKRDLPNAAGKIPKELAMDEHNDLWEHKTQQWGQQVYKDGMFKLVDEFGKKDMPDDIVYNNVFGLHQPDAVIPPKEYKPGRWRISKIPDPACKLDPYEEKDFMKRWKSTAKKLP